MSFQSSTATTHSTEISSIGVLPTDCVPQWGQKLPDKVTQVTPQTASDAGALDSNILSVSDSLERLLHQFIVVLLNRSRLFPSNQHLEELLKRYIVAVIAVSYLEHEKLELTFEFNLALPNLPTEGIHELVHSVDDICDFYSYVDDSTSAAPTVETLTLELKRS